MFPREFDDGVISREPFTHKVRVHQTGSSPWLAGQGSPVKKEFNLAPAQPAVFIDHLDQSVFILDILQPDPRDFWDQVMTINYIFLHFRHACYCILILCYDFIKRAHEKTPALSHA